MPALRTGTHEGCPYSSRLDVSVQGGDGKPSPYNGVADIGMHENGVCSRRVAASAFGNAGESCGLFTEAGRARYSDLPFL